MGIELDDILGFNFFQYGSPYIGECGGMHFRLARNPLENVVFNHDPHKNDEALFDVTIWRGPYNYDKTRQKKFGAMLGDFVEVGCNSVLNPGTVIGPHSNVYPTSCVRGMVPANSIWKTGGIIVAKK